MKVIPIKPREEMTVVEKEMFRLLETMAEIDDQTSDMYKRCEEMLDKLAMTNDKIETTKLKKKGVKDREPLNINTILTLLSSGAELVTMMNFERIHVWTTKALSRWIRPKL